MKDETYGKEIICPYCGYEHRDSWETMRDYNDSWFETQCDKCDLSFEAIRNISVDYCARIGPKESSK